MPIDLTKKDMNDYDIQSLPTYREPELIYLLMSGALIDEYTKILPDNVGILIKDETSIGTECGNRLEENFRMIEESCIRLEIDGESEEIQIIYDRFYKLLELLTEDMYEMALTKEEIDITKVKLVEYVTQLKDFVDSISRLEDKLQDGTLIDKIASNFMNVIAIYVNKADTYGKFFKGYKM